MKTLILAGSSAVANRVAVALGAELLTEGATLGGSGRFMDSDDGQFVAYPVPAYRFALGLHEKDTWSVHNLPLVPGVPVLAHPKDSQIWEGELTTCLANDFDLVVNTVPAASSLDIDILLHKAGAQGIPVHNVFLSDLSVAGIQEAFANIIPGLYGGDDEIESVWARSMWLLEENLPRLCAIQTAEALRIGLHDVALLAAVAFDHGGRRPEDLHQVEVEIEVEGTGQLIMATSRPIPRDQATALADLCLAKGTLKIFHFTTIQEDVQPPLPYNLPGIVAAIFSESQGDMEPREQVQGLVRLFDEQHIITRPCLARQVPAAMLGRLHKAIGVMAERLFTGGLARALDMWPSSLDGHPTVCEEFGPSGIVPVDAENLERGLAVAGGALTMICRRALAAFMPAAKVEYRSLTIGIKDPVLTALGRVIHEQGWLMAEPPATMQDVPKLKPGTRVLVSDARVVPFFESNIDSNSLANAWQSLGRPNDQALLADMAASRFVSFKGGDIQLNNAGVSAAQFLKETLPELVTRPGFLACDRGLDERVFKSLQGAVGRVKRMGDKMNLGPCPQCGEPVARSAQGFVCSDSNCSFRVWGTVAGLEVPVSIIRELLKHGKTARMVHGLRRRDGSKFASRLRLSHGEKGWGYRFMPSDQTRVA